MNVPSVPSIMDAAVSSIKKMPVDPDWRADVSALAVIVKVWFEKGWPPIDPEPMPCSVKMMGVAFIPVTRASTLDKATAAPAIRVANLLVAFTSGLLAPEHRL